MTIRLLVLSDMHVVGKEGGTISRISIETPEMPPETNPVESIKVFLENYHNEIDYLINLGDVSDKSEKACWFYGIRLLREIQLSKGIRNLIHVVGNHDVICKGDIPEGDNFFLPKHTKDYPVIDNQVRNEFWSKDYCIYALDNLLLLIVNTEVHLKDETCLNNAPKISETKIREIEHDLQQYKDYKGAKIALMHHHIIMHSDKYGNYTSNDVLEKGDTLLDVLDNNGFKMVIHGHKHLPRIMNYKDVVVFASGSFSSLENLQMINADNLFHIIQLDIDDNTINGFIETYRYVHNQGWMAVSDPYALFIHHVGLGIQKDMKELADEIIAKYKQRLDRGVQIHVDEYKNDFPGIQYLSKKQFDDLINHLKNSSYILIPDNGLLLKLIS